MAKKDENLPTVADEAALPAYMQQHTGRAVAETNLGAADMIIPRIKLLQAISPEVTEFNEAKAGEFWHSVLGEPIGPTFKFIVISVKKHYILFAPRGAAQPILARAPDGVHWNPPDGVFEVKLKGVAKPVVYKTAPTVAQSGLAKFGSSIPGDDNSPPAATEMVDYLVFLPEHPEFSPAIISLSRSGIRASKDLWGKINLRAAKVPQFGQVYEARHTDETSADGPYFGWGFSNAGIASQEHYEHVAALNAQFANIDYEAHDLATAADADSGPRSTGGGAVDENIPF